jgi:hypothetical protein
MTSYFGVKITDWHIKRAIDGNTSDEFKTYIANGASEKVKKVFDSLHESLHHYFETGECLRHNPETGECLDWDEEVREALKDCERGTEECNMLYEIMPLGVQAKEDIRRVIKVQRELLSHEEMKQSCIGFYDLPNNYL